jgi:hypothetical protein
LVGIREFVLYDEAIFKRDKLMLNNVKNCTFNILIKPLKEKKCFLLKKKREEKMFNLYLILNFDPT